MTTGNDAGNGSSSIAFKELKRKARAVKARPRRKADRGGPVATAPITPTHIELVTSASSKQTESAPAPCQAATTALTREDRWRSAGEIQATVDGRSLNPRILDILLPSGGRARAIIKPSEHGKFGRRKPVWVKKDDRGKNYIVVGGYSQWGVRHS